MDKCPITGIPCNNPKVIHITDVGPDYTATKSYDLCQVCGANKVQQQEQPQQPTNLVSSLFGMLTAILAAKMQQLQGTTPVPVVEQPPAQIPLPQIKPPCPECGASIYDIQKTSRLGCPYCYEWYKNELMPALIHAHKATEHLGKRPKPKSALVEDLPLEEQIYVLEMQMKQAAEQEQYEKAKELKNKIATLKATNPQSESPSD